VADWDANSPRLLRNLLAIGDAAAGAAASRQPLNSGTLRAWHVDMMAGLETGDGVAPGVFRGEAGLEGYEVEVAGVRGVAAGAVAAQLLQFDATLYAMLDELDTRITPRPGARPMPLDGDTLMAVLILCAWAHGEWVRIHPLPNGNGRCARLLVNTITLRCGLPALLVLRPRPGDEYAAVAQRAMHGDWKAAVPLFARLLAIAVRA
jgi:hypothetical protein